MTSEDLGVLIDTIRQGPPSVVGFDEAGANQAVIPPKN